MNGFINIYKPRGISSAKAVALVKKCFKGSKVGHAGTLDPEAEGVLPIAVGEATKLIRFLECAKKGYEFRVQFGKQTDTGDIAGSVIAETDKSIDRDSIDAVLARFIGKIEQIPPKYSAIKIDGKRAYDLVRQNAEFEMKSRQVEVFALQLEDFDTDARQAVFKSLVSKGTYIRTLAEDISLALQNLGFVLELRRTIVGGFVSDQALHIAKYLDGDWLEATQYLADNMLKLESVLDDIPVLEADKQIAEKIRFGQQVTFELDGDSSNLDEVWIRYERKILAIGLIRNGGFKSSRVFNL